MCHTGSGSDTNSCVYSIVPSLLVYTLTSGTSTPRRLVATVLTGAEEKTVLAPSKAPVCWAEESTGVRLPVQATPCKSYTDKPGMISCYNKVFFIFVLFFLMSHGSSVPAWDSGKSAFSVCPKEVGQMGICGTTVNHGTDFLLVADSGRYFL